MKYRYHWSFKLLALLLAVLSGAVLAVGTVCMVVRETEMYRWSQESMIYSNLEAFCEISADAVFDRFAWEGTDIEPKLFERFFRWGADVDAVEGLEHEFQYAIHSGRDMDGEFLAGNLYDRQEISWHYGDVYSVRRGYVTVMPKAEYYPTYQEFRDQGTEGGPLWLDLEGQPLPELGDKVHEYQYYVVSDAPDVNWQNVASQSYDHADAKGADYTIYRIEYTRYDSYYVEVGLTEEQRATLEAAYAGGEDVLAAILAKSEAYDLYMIVLGAAGLLLSGLWLILMAGKSHRRTELRPGGLNRLPLDLYAAVTVGGAALMVLFVVLMTDEAMWENAYGNFTNDGIQILYLYGVGIALCGGGVGLLAAMFTMAASAQFKMGKLWWLKHSFVGFVWKWMVRAVKWCWRTLKKGLGAVARFAHRFMELLPLSWQWFLATVGLWLVSIVGIFLAYESWSAWPIILCALLTFVVVLYGAYCFGQLRDSARKMSGGNLTEKIENKFLLGCFGDFAGHLNALGDVCVESARQQMKSERMKTELITNVSHDIKTPLTSIINYVDLLRRTDDEAARAEYLAILDNQSQRLKKLIEDLMEMSRASSGNVTVEITPTDVGEALHQALGEFADRLEQRGLTVMTKIPAEPVMAQCDGRHLWRVLSNCLSNVVKYAMPGTRVYVDLERKAGMVEISLKNISAQTLNISSDELMERFVRGDSSRNTEGNGLGLNIAKSLMEVQGGKLDLVVDGDLFKVILTLNAE